MPERALQRAVGILVLAAGVTTLAAAAPIEDEASAIAEARKYVRARCNANTPCSFKPRREGKRWNVWVEFTKRSSPGAKPRPYHGGHVILYFDAEGRLLKRIEGQ